MESIRGLVMRAGAVLIGSAVIGASIASNPATAQDVRSFVQFFGTTVCSNSSFCKVFRNNGSGAGVAGVAGSGNGVYAQSTSGNGTYSASESGPGVFSYSLNNDGINSGTSNNSTIHAPRSGVWGHDDSTDGGISNVGVAGSSINGTGVSASSTNGRGVLGKSTNFNGVEGDSTNSVGVAAGSTGLVALVAYDGVGSGEGADIGGGFIGVVGRAPAGSGTYPMVLTDQVGNNLIIANGNGDFSIHGAYKNFARVRNGNTVMAYGPTSASPSMEDTGSGHLVDGVAIVDLDSTFAQSIDPRQAYHVMLTPDGDTRGLFVASKEPDKFVVREVQGGHGSLSFDYHIYAAKLGHANDRMVEMTPAQAAAFMPHAKPVGWRPSKVRSRLP